MTRTAREGLQFKYKLSSLLGSCRSSMLVKEHTIERSKHMASRYRGSTFEVLSLEKNRAYVILLDQGPDLVSDRSAIKAHHEQLAELPGLYRSACGHDGMSGTYLDSSHRGGTSPLVAITV